MISNEFLLVISMLKQSEKSWELRAWSTNMNSLDVFTTSSHYVYKKFIGQGRRVCILILGIKGLSMLLAITADFQLMMTALNSRTFLQIIKVARSYLILSYDPYGSASAFFAKPLIKVTHEGCTHLCERSWKKPYGPTTKAYSLTCYNFKEICQTGHMIKYLLTKLGLAWWENI